MSRKRTNLDTAEAEYLYANILLEFNKYDSFNDLVIPERNNIIYEVCLNVVRKTCKNVEHIEAVIHEILSYKQSKDEEKLYNDNVSGVEKPENFYKILEKRYHEKIVELVKRTVEFQS